MRRSSWFVLENIITVASTAAAITGLYFAGAGGWSFIALVLLINTNTKIPEDKP